MLKARDKRSKLVPEDGSEVACPVIKIEITSESSSKRQENISVLDINDSGMGVSCDFQLKVGHKIAFIEEQLDWQLPEHGVVMWTFKTNDGFQAGIKFI